MCLNVPHLENVLKRAFISYPPPPRWTVSRDIDQFPSPLDNSHQPSKHALFIFTHLKVIKPSNQRTFSWPCTPPLGTSPFLCSPSWQNSLKEFSIPCLLLFNAVSPQPTLMGFPPTPPHWKDPYQGHQCGFVKVNSLFSFHFWTALDILDRVFLPGTSSSPGLCITLPWTSLAH